MQPRRLISVFSALVLLIASSQAFAQTLLTVNRYAGMPDFMRSRQTVWLKTDDGFQQTDSPQLSDDSTCSMLLNQHQQFSLAQMILRGFLKDESSARAYMNLLTHYHPSQISFLQISHLDQPRVEAALPNAHVLEKALIQLQTPVHATLSVVSGQYIAEDGTKIATTPLPWQLEEHLRPLAMKLDRNRYRFVSEWGRAGQVNPKDIDDLMMVAALLQLEELHAMGQNIADGWVTFHSLDRVHTVAYKRRFRDSIFGEENSETGEAIFLIPLAKVFESIHPERGNETLQALMKEGLDVDRAAYLMQFFRRAEHSEFTAVDRYSGKVHAHPVLVTDFSDLQPEIIQAHLTGIRTPSEKIDPIHQELNGSRSYTYTANHPRAHDYAFTPMVTKTLADENSILLTNLSPEAAKLDNYYVETMMYAVLKAKFEMLREYDPSWTFTNFWQFLIDQKIRFAVYTTDAEIKAQLLRVFATPRYQEVAVTGAKVLTAIEQAQWVKPTTEIQYRFSFSMEELAKDMQFDPNRRDWFENPRYILNYGRFAIEHALMGASGVQ